MSHGIQSLKCAGENFKTVIQHEYSQKVQTNPSNQQIALSEYNQSVDEFAAWRSNFEEKLRSFSITQKSSPQILIGYMESICTAGQVFKNFAQSRYLNQKRGGDLQAELNYRHAIDKFAAWTKEFELELRSFPKCNGGGVHLSAPKLTAPTAPPAGGRQQQQSKGGGGYE
jgi:hypothetical protein